MKKLSGHAEISKFLSYVLRHKPEAIGLELDTEGWGSIDALVRGASDIGNVIDPLDLAAAVETNDKQRFEISPDQLSIRAVQGHSTPLVNRQMEAVEPPDLLYHGTTVRFMSMILEIGILPGTRHHVHLTDHRATAMAVGKRYGAPVVLEVRSKDMHLEGYRFYRAENGVWLTNLVPQRFIQLRVEEDPFP